MNALRFKLLVCLVVVSLLVIPSGHAALAQGQGNVTLPYNETGVFANAEYEIRVPAKWNGVLLVYAHGYAFDAPPPAAAPALPCGPGETITATLDNVTLANNTADAYGGALFIDSPS